MARRVNAAALIDRLRAIAMALPGVMEKISHGEPAFFVRKRMFCMIDNNHHDSGHVAAWFNASPGAQESLVGADSRHFFIPPYLGPKGWIGVRIDSDLSWDTIAELARQAHAITGVKRSVL